MAAISSCTTITRSNTRKKSRKYRKTKISTKFPTAKLTLKVPAKTGVAEYLVDTKGGNSISSKVNKRNSTVASKYPNVKLDPRHFTMRKSMRLIIRKVKDGLLDIDATEVPCPHEMPRTVELITGHIEIKTDQVKILYMAALGLYRKPDERGMSFQCGLLQSECDKFVESKSAINIESSNPITTYPIEIQNEIHSPNKVQDEIHSQIRMQNEIIPPVLPVEIISGDKEVEAGNAKSVHWNANVVIVPASQNKSSNFSQIYSVDVCNTESPSDLNNFVSITTDDDEQGDWKSFGSYMEAQLHEEIIVQQQFSQQEIEEAKMKLASIQRSRVY